MKILFIHPYGNNFLTGVPDITTIFNVMPPLGLLSIMAWLEKHQISSEIIDCYATPMPQQELVAEIIRRKPDLVAFSCTTSSFPEGNRIAEALKTADNRIRIVFGGAHACTMGAPLLDRFPAIDCLVLGEGEQTMLELVRSDFRNLAAIPGLAYRDADGNGCQSPPRELIANLDDLPFPAYHLLPGFPYRYKLPLFSSPRFPNTSIISSRGCPYQCSYCDRSVFARGFRFNSPDYILEHVAMLQRDYGIRHVFFYDDLFTFDRKRVARFCELKAKMGLKVGYNCIARLEHVDQELLGLLKSSGCWQVNFGIESGDPEILKKHRKFYGLDAVGRKLQLVKDHGMRVKGLFMVGLPGEDETAIRRTIDYALSLPLDEINVTKFTPFPGAPVYQTLQQFGEFHEEWELMNCMNFVFIPHGMTKQQLEGLYDEFIRRFYRRSRIHWGYTKMIWKSPHSVLDFLKNLPAILKFEKETKMVKALLAAALIALGTSSALAGAPVKTTADASYELTLLSGYGISHRDFGETRTQVQTFDIIPRLGWFLSDEIGKGSWYQGRHQLLVELPYHLAVDHGGRSMVGGYLLGSWKFTSLTNLKPYIFAGGGPVYVDLGLPSMGAKLNFSYQGGTGVQIPIAQATMLNLEYRYHHISNAGTATPNEPLNSSKFLLGISWLY